MILYFGDDDMTRAAAYLAGILHHFNLPFEHIDSTAPLSDALLSQKVDAFILSDYPRKRFKDGQLEKIRDAVSHGAGLLMIGGWESFYGKNGEYHDTCLAEVLPVTMQNHDDRRQFCQPLMVRLRRPHPVLDKLSWSRPPCIVGLNSVKAKPNTETVLEALRIDIRVVDEDQVADYLNDSICFVSGKPIDERASLSLPSGETLLVSVSERFPLLTLGKFGQGRTAAYMSDAAPHWVGNFIDWGHSHIAQTLPGGHSIEVGADYAQFFHQLVSWTAKQM